MELSEDPKGDWITQVMSCQMTIICCSGDLPEVFTLCSSVLAEHVTVDRHFFQLYKVKIINLGTFLLNYYLFACLFVEWWLTLAHIAYDGHRQKSSKRDGRKVKLLSPSRYLTLNLSLLAILLGKNFVWWDLNILTGSPWVTMKSSTTSLIRGYPWILSLGAINAQTSTRDLVLSDHNMIKLFIIIIKRTYHRCY